MGGEKGHCVLYGDPHILTFDKWSQDVRVLFQEDGTYWIVRSPRISIQGHYERMDFSEHQYANGWITSLTVSGTFLEGHELTFTAGVEGEAQLIIRSYDVTLPFGV